MKNKEYLLDVVYKHLILERLNILNIHEIKKDLINEIDIRNGKIISFKSKYNYETLLSLINLMITDTMINTNDYMYYGFVDILKGNYKGKL